MITLFFLIGFLISVVLFICCFVKILTDDEKEEEEAKTLLENTPAAKHVEPYFKDLDHGDYQDVYICKTCGKIGDMYSMGFPFESCSKCGNDTKIETIVAWNKNTKKWGSKKDNADILKEDLEEILEQKY